VCDGEDGERCRGEKRISSSACKKAVKSRAPHAKEGGLRTEDLWAYSDVLRVAPGTLLSAELKAPCQSPLGLSPRPFAILH
jgi:hypothetical protein